MKVLWNGYIGKLHSWSIVAQNLIQQFINHNYDLDAFSTNGIDLVPKNILPYIKGFLQDKSSYSEKEYIDLTSKLLKNYDVQMSYTAMRNFPSYFSRGSRNRFGIWCYEFAGKNALPSGFAKNHVYVDKILAPSTNAKDIFIDSNIPESKIEILPHGYNYSFINRDVKLFEFKNEFVFGANIAQPHLRKNIYGLLDAWGKAFNKKDNVCLAIKISTKTNNQPFEVNFYEILNNFKSKYKDHAKIVLFDKFIEDISDFYRSCDAIYSLSNAECFLMPALEALAAKKILICSNYGGQLDFCNSSNSFLVDGSMVRANPKMLYWENKNNTYVFEPNINDAVEKLKYVYNNHQNINFNYNEIIEKYSWSNIFINLERLIK